MTHTADYALQAIKQRPMSRYQILIVALCTLIAALDGFDVLVVAYTGPAISQAWSLTPTDLGLLFGSGLAGMGVGAVTVAPIGDVIGRKPTILICLGLLLAGMLLSAFTSGLYELAIMRVVTGMGIGGILANANIVVAEFSSARRKALCVSFMSAGYPVGATLGGMFSVYLIEAHGWPSVYLFGACGAAVLLPLVWWLMPESLDYLMAKRPKNALGRCNSVLAKMQLPAIDELPLAQQGTVVKSGYALVSDGDLRARLLFSCLAYFCVMMSCYFLLSWTPQILTSSGLTQRMGISGSLLMNLGGIAGCFLYGVLAPKLGQRKFAAVFMVGLTVSAVIFAAIPAGPGPLLVAAVAVGVCLFSAINSLYVIIPEVFPGSSRSTGTGLAMGAGRLGAVTGPVVAGYLIAAGLDKTVYIALLSAPMLLAAICLFKMSPFADTSEKSADEANPSQNASMDVLYIAPKPLRLNSR